MPEHSITLLVRADDIGFCQAANQACMDVFTRGICRSVELMAPCPWFPQAVRLLQAHPGYDVGVHFTLTSEWENMKWRPISDAKSIAAEDGFFYRTYRKNDNYPDEITFEEADWTPTDVETELRAQIELIRKHLPWASHATTHMGGLRDTPAFQGVVDGLIAEYNLGVDLDAYGFERFPAFGENSQALTPAQKIHTFCQSLEALTPGRWIHVDHPAYDTPETRQIHHVGYEGVAADRQGVVEAWTDAEVQAIIKQRNIQLVSYGDVKRGNLNG